MSGELYVIPVGREQPCMSGISDGKVRRPFLWTTHARTPALAYPRGVWHAIATHVPEIIGVCLGLVVVCAT